MTSSHAGFSTHVNERDANGVATEWAGTCACKRIWLGATYEYVEDKWREHFYNETGALAGPMGNKEGRWKP